MNIKNVLFIVVFFSLLGSLNSQEMTSQEYIDSFHAGRVRPIIDYIAYENDINAANIGFNYDHHFMGYLMVRIFSSKRKKDFIYLGSSLNIESYNNVSSMNVLLSISAQTSILKVPVKIMNGVSISSGKINDNDITVDRGLTESEMEAISPFFSVSFNGKKYTSIFGLQEFNEEVYVNNKTNIYILNESKVITNYGYYSGFNITNEIQYFSLGYDFNIVEIASDFYLRSHINPFHLTPDYRNPAEKYDIVSWDYLGINTGLSFVYIDSYRDNNEYPIEIIFDYSYHNIKKSGIKLAFNAIYDSFADGTDVDLHTSFGFRYNDYHVTPYETDFQKSFQLFATLDFKF